MASEVSPVSLGFQLLLPPVLSLMKLYDVVMLYRWMSGMFHCSSLKQLPVTRLEGCVAVFICLVTRLERMMQVHALVRDISYNDRRSINSICLPNNGFLIT